MKKTVKSKDYFPWVLKFDLKMKLSILFLLTINLVMQANTSYAQKTKISLSVKNTSVEKVIIEIEAKTKFKFIFNTNSIDLTRQVSLNVNKVSIKEVLNLLFKDEQTSYEIDNRKVLLKKSLNKNDTLNPKPSSTSKKKQDQINGTVFGADGEPLFGANVIEKGTKNGITVDYDGKFSITVSNNAILQISFIGYETKEIPVNGRQTISIILDESAAALDEVVIIGYGTQKRSKVVSAIDQVSEGAFKGRASINTTQALQGQSPSLTIQQRNSEPGAGLSINIRGISTLGSNAPLIVIDGIVGGDINALNTTDIENVSVLKDAGSAAIYGSRASNGVILITTKKGNKNTAMSVSYNGLVGYNSPYYFTKPVHGYENAILRNEASYNSNESSAIFTSAEIAKFKADGDNEWFANEIVNDALQQNHNLSVSGGNENSTYLVSVGYLNQGSNFVGPAKGMERYNYRINLTNEYGNFKLTSNLSYSKQKIIDHSSSTGNIMVDAFRVPLYYKQKDEDGNYLTNDILNEFNSLGILEQGGYRKYDNDDVFGNLSAELKLTSFLKLRGVFGGRLWSSNQFSRTKTVDFFPKGVYGADNNTDDTSRKSLDLNTQLILEFEKIFIQKHELNVLVGASNENHSDRGIGIFKKYTDPDLGTPTSETEISDNSYNSNQSSSKNSLNSLFGRTAYSFDNKYFAEVSFRYDGSSKFRKEKRWGFFPSVSLGYNITNEAFLNDYKQKLGNIKIRASYGILGNQNVGNYQYQTTYFTFQNAYGFNNTGVSGTGYNFANPDIQWEKAATFNVGTDVDFFSSALTLSFDYFNKVTSDILVPPAVPGVYGSNLPDFNAGKVGSKGWELSVTYKHYGNLFKHSLNFSLGDSKNEVLDFQGNEKLTSVAELQVLLREGLPFNSYVGLKRDGIFNSIEEIENAAVPEGLTVVPGDNRYVDLNKDGVINDEDKFIFGNPFPRFTYGLTYNVSFKGFDLSMFIQGVGKRTMMIRGELVEPFHVNYGATMYTHQLDFWTPQNTDAYYPRLANAGTQSITNNFRRGSNMYLYDGAYARLKNLQIGYTLPKDVTEKLGMKSYRIYLSGQNLLTLSKVKFVDPELSEFNSNLSSSGGNSGRAYPTLVYYGLGLDITF
ncbi:TonB-dependent receptor [Aureibaculum algae]|uniref:TonB-dependent receptor n=1 Tax=Aureibaculum algae TaxID=2584122 RepID=A0A5B7TPR9_9FLAO|nr:TonB-dependent receptor [Aureibaculum algae]QCX37441.1 TonB-dependent receptor [Aureibaculum algae]